MSDEQRAPRSHRVMAAALAPERPLYPDQPGYKPWDAWYASLPDDLRRRLSIYDFKRLGDCFKTAFGLELKDERERCVKECIGVVTETWGADLVTTQTALEALISQPDQAGKS